MLDEIYVSVSEFPKEIAKGKTYTERKEILWRCYASNPKKEDIDNLSLQDMIDYIKDTDEFYEDDKKYIDECVRLIEEVE